MGLQRQAYPPPPAFYKLYKGAQEGGEGEGRAPPAPPAPLEGEYHIFGEIHETRDGIPDIPVQRLFKEEGQIDFKKELLKMNQEVLFAFLELISNLIERPTAYARQLEAIGVLLRNMHQLLNKLRPHQALATMEYLLKTELEEMRQLLGDVREQVDSANRMLHSAGDSLVAACGEEAYGLHDIPATQESMDTGDENS
ncbi:unnamed protein product [Ostreobium quekettii]|uniref:Mediator of RNA polymerase II transcription subunit 7 n=1 Tax=Ostreobium quekettii TaxID=121088 RepID=A0A8S1IZ46_9CHLO|nr:unnamed protein product [Ostreobium quekettii]|eukprot:evm.model.scf_3882.1 EVM.evm.TU.scf_3882.1   scf_3882:1203-5357(+)